MSAKLAQRNLLLTLDVFETLIRPRAPIGVQYLEVAKRFNLKLDNISPVTMEKAFKIGLRGQSHTRHLPFTKKKKENPLYGQAMGISTEEWWCKVVEATLSSFTKEDIPHQLPANLFHRFSSAEGYELHEDVLPFLESLKQETNRWPYAPLSTDLTAAFNNRFKHISPRDVTDELTKLESLGFYHGLSKVHPQPQPQHLLNHNLNITNPSLPHKLPRLNDVTILGIISNSDPRVPFILESLGIKHYFASPLICLSHELGVQKPSREIFRQCRQRALLLTGIKNWEDWDVVHIGNCPKEDFETPEKLKGFKGVWLDRRRKGRNMSRPVGHMKVTRRITNLSEVIGVIGSRWREGKEKEESIRLLREKQISELGRLIQTRTARRM